MGSNSVRMATYTGRRHSLATQSTSSPGLYEKMHDLPLRAPGHLERCLIHQNAIGFHSSCQVTAVYTIDLNESAEFSRNELEELVIAALGKTLCCHPILGTTLRDVDSAWPTWKRLEHVNVRRIVQFIDADHQSNIEELMQAEHRRYLTVTEDLPLWRCLIVTPYMAGCADSLSFTMSFSWHRAVGDGYSAVYFHQTFLEALNLLLSTGGRAGDLNPTANQKVQVPHLPLVPHLEESMAFPFTPCFLFSKILNSLSATLYSPADIVPWSGRPIKDIEEQPPISYVRAFQLSQEEVTRIVNLARHNQATVTALTTVLTARRLARLYGPAYTRFIGSVPFSLRKFLRDNRPGDMGLFTGVAEVSFCSDHSRPQGYIPCGSSTTLTDKSLAEDEVLWNNVRACKNVIHRRSESSVNLTNGLMKFVGDFRPHLVKLVGSRRRHAFCVTNLGVVDGGLASQPKGVSKKAAAFDKLYASSGNTAISEPYVVGLASVAGGYMTVTLNWDEGVVDKSDALALLSGLEQDLKSIATPTTRQSTRSSRL
ncbi:hypothetical protein LZ30DRAFT_693911 [Colletotrichum cereale]|nr:hypothetical protein LZ30DRAFT_693911 [Colletotrichum cereale]